MEFLFIRVELDSLGEGDDSKATFHFHVDIKG